MKLNVSHRETLERSFKRESWYHNYPGRVIIRRSMLYSTSQWRRLFLATCKQYLFNWINTKYKNIFSTRDIRDLSETNYFTLYSFSPLQIRKKGPRWNMWNKMRTGCNERSNKNTYFLVVDRRTIIAKKNPRVFSNNILSNFVYNKSYSCTGRI